MALSTPGSVLSSVRIPFLAGISGLALLGDSPSVEPGRARAAQERPRRALWSLERLGESSRLAQLELPPLGVSAGFIKPELCLCKAIPVGRAVTGEGGLSSSNCCHHTFPVTPDIPESMSLHAQLTLALISPPAPSQHSSSEMNFHAQTLPLFIPKPICSVLPTFPAAHLFQWIRI